MTIIDCQMVNVEEWLLSEQAKLGGINEAELARKIGVDQGVIYNAKNRNSIGPDLARKIADGIGRSQQEVFYELGLMTEKPGDLIIKDPILADIWAMIDSMTPDEKLAARVLLERMFGGGDDGRRDSKNRKASSKSK